MICEVLGVPFSEATSADALTDVDRHVAIAISEARRLYREATERRKG